MIEIRRSNADWVADRIIVPEHIAGSASIELTFDRQMECFLLHQLDDQIAFTREMAADFLAALTAAIADIAVEIAS